MKKPILFLLLGLPFFMNGQLVNNNATIVIESGAKLVVEGNITNTGSITNDGEMEVKGNLDNTAGTITSAAASKITFSGSGDQLLTSNGAVLENIDVNQTSAARVLLQDPLAVNGTINFLADGKITLGTHNLSLGSAADIIGESANRYIVADESGAVVKNFSTAPSFNFAVGDATNYSPLSVNTVAETNATLAVKVDPTALDAAELPVDVADYLNRNWDINETGFTNFSATVTGTYVAGDVNGDATKINGASYDLLAWSYANADGDDIAKTVTGDIDGDVLFTGTNVYRRQPIKVFLAGPFNGTTMNTTLNSSGLIPNFSPYDGDMIADIAGTVQALNPNIVDWVSVELRTPADGSTVTQVYNKFLLNDGSIVDLDGSTSATFRDGIADAFIAVKHRNHLGVMTANTLQLGTVNLLDFTDTGTATFGVESQKTINTINVLWGGNGNNDKIVRFKNQAFPPVTGDDTYLLQTILGNNTTLVLSNVYNNGDFNMDGRVRYKNQAFPPITGDGTFLLQTILNNNTTKVVTQQF